MTQPGKKLIFLHNFFFLIYNGKRRSIVFDHLKCKVSVISLALLAASPSCSYFVVFMMKLVMFLVSFRYFQVNSLFLFYESGAWLCRPSPLGCPPGSDILARTWTGVGSGKLRSSISWRHTRATWNGKASVPIDMTCGPPVSTLTRGNTVLMYVCNPCLVINTTDCQ